MSCLGLQGVELQLCRAAEAAEQAAAAASVLREERDAVGAFAALVDALAALAMPVLLFLVIWRLWPVLRDIFETRKFTIKIAGFELSAQEATDQLRTQIEDLQRKVAELSEPSAQERRTIIDGPDLDRAPRNMRILWVDDQPLNNALLIASFRDSGIEVTTALTTADAVALLSDLPERFAAVISDQGRIEDGKYRASAGTELLRQMQEMESRPPTAIFTSARGVRMGKDALKAGAELVTDSGTELRSFVERHVGGARAD
jgi:CheY-like chemotaxis protein